MRKMLLVEDDRVIAGIYRAKFHIEGFEVEVAADGESAIASLKQAMPELVLLDLMLPGINGVQVIEFIRAHPKGVTVPVIVFSNSYLSSLLQAAWKAGATKCLTKHDCTPKQVIEIVRQLMTKPLAADPPALRPAPAKSEPSSEVAITDLRQSLVNSSEGIVHMLREQLRGLSRSDANAPLRSTALAELYRNVHSLTGTAGLAGHSRTAQLCSVLEALLKELESKPARLTPSTLRTIAQSLDVIGPLFTSAHAADRSLAHASVLVLDDDHFCRQAVSAALTKAGLRCLLFEHPASAIEVARENAFDLMFLDVEMPGWNGFEVCRQLREQPLNRRTPVVFVTSLTDFETRTRSVLAGGSDLIAKPFLLLELALKAVTYLLKPQTQTSEPLAAAA